MKGQVLYRFPVSALQRRLPRSWLLQEGNGGLLALACYGNLVSTAPFTGTLSWYLLDIETGSLLKEARSPHLLNNLDALHLAYDASTATWLVGSLEFLEETTSFEVVVRLIGEAENGQTLLSAPIFHDPANDMAPIGPILAVQASGQHYTLLYRKPDIDCVSTPAICLGQIDMTTGHVEQSIKDYADSALVCYQEDRALLLSLVLRIGGVSLEGQAVFTGVTRDWGFSVTGYSRDFHTEDWYHDLDLHMAAGQSPVLQGHSDFEWLGINAAAIPGPSLAETRQETYVIGITMMDVFDRPYEDDHTSEEASWITNHVETLLCIDTDGKVIQTCTDAIGLRVQLCRVQATVVGVDLLKGQWRLWNWVPLSETSFQKLVWLDQHIQRAHVVAGKGEEERDVGYFWLIEESSVGVRVSKYDASTLMKIGSNVTVTDMHLLEPQNGSGSLDWHTSIEAMTYQDGLLLLGVEHDQLVLYQVK